MHKDWNSYVGRKFDMLTVAGIIAPAMAQKMLNLSYKQTHFVCVCECGAVRYATAVAVERGYITSCGSDSCKNKIKRSKRAATRAKLKITDEKPLLPLLEMVAVNKGKLEDVYGVYSNGCIGITRRENCNMLKKSLVAVAKNATTPLKKL